MLVKVVVICMATKTHLVYAWLDQNGEPFYVGKTCNLAKRNNCHKTVIRSEGRRAQTRSYRKLKKLLREGIEWKINILEIGIPESDVCTQEMYWIDHLRKQGFDLCNHTDGGDGGDTFSSKSDEDKAKIKRKMSKSHRRRHAEASSEQKKKWANSKRGKRSPEARRRMSEARQGIKFSKEHKNNLSAARKKRVTSKETGLRISRTNLGKINIKRYELTSPDGVVYITEHGLSDFCRKHNLSRSNMVKVANGERYHHKGWSSKRLDI